MSEEITISVDAEFAGHLAYMLNQMSCSNCPFADETNPKHCFYDGSTEEPRYCIQLEWQIKGKLQPEKMEDKKVVVFDFDGVIHSYVTPYKQPDVIPDGPIYGIRFAIQDIRNAGYRVIVVSSRAQSKKGKIAIIDWLHKYDICVDGVSAQKVPAIAYIDDRAIFFDGHSESLLGKIKELEKNKNDS